MIFPEMLFEPIYDPARDPLRIIPPYETRIAGIEMSCAEVTLSLTWKFWL